MNKNPTRDSELPTVQCIWMLKQKVNPEGWRLGNLALIHQLGILAALALVSHERSLCTGLDLVSQINSLCHCSDEELFPIFNYFLIRISAGNGFHCTLSLHCLCNSLPQGSYFCNKVALGAQR